MLEQPKQFNFSKINDRANDVDEREKIYSAEEEKTIENIKRRINAHNLLREQKVLFDSIYSDKEKTRAADYMIESMLEFGCHEEAWDLASKLPEESKASHQVKVAKYLAKIGEIEKAKIFFSKIEFHTEKNENKEEKIKKYSSKLHFEIADSLSKSGKIDEAILAIGEISSKDKADPSGKEKFGNMIEKLVDAGKIEEAYDISKRVSNEYGMGNKMLISVTNALLRKNDFESKQRADRIIKEILEVEREGYSKFCTILDLAAVLTRYGYVQQAKDLSKEIPEYYSDDTRFKKSIAGEFIRLEKFDDAQEIAIDNTTDCEILLYITKKYAEKDNKEKTQELIELITFQANKYAESYRSKIYLEVAEILDTIGEKEKVKQILIIAEKSSAAVMDNCERASRYIKIAEFKYHLGERDEVNRLLEIAEEANEKVEVYYRNLRLVGISEVRAKIGDVKGVEKMFNELVQILPKDEDDAKYYSLTLIPKSLAENKEYAAAINLANKIPSNKTKYRAMQDIAVILVERGNIKEAIEVQKKVNYSVYQTYFDKAVMEFFLPDNNLEEIRKTIKKATSGGTDVQTLLEFYNDKIKEYFKTKEDIKPEETNNLLEIAKANRDMKMLELLGAVMQKEDIISLRDKNTKDIIEKIETGFIKHQQTSILNIDRNAVFSEKIIKEVGLEEASNSLFNDDYMSALGVRDRIGLEEELFKDAVKKAIVENLENNCGIKAINMAEKALSMQTMQIDELATPEVQKAAARGIVDMFSDGNLDYVIKIKDFFALPEEIIKSSEIQTAAKRGIINCLNRNYVGESLRVKEEFAVKISSEEIINESPGLPNFLKEIEMVSLELFQQIYKSEELLISLFEFKKDWKDLPEILKQNQFLIGAIINNPRFGSRLGLKFIKFDATSKENIEKQFSIKKKIMTENPEMDSESLEFRQLMQKELKKFKNNPDIMAAIEKQGIDLEEWLNYSETSYFNLSTDGNEIAFSEKIRTPIDRIKETIDSYAHTIKSVLKEYRPEMEKYEIILEDAGPIEEQIAKMEVALKQTKTEGNEKKAQGIEKGLASQKEKLNNLKKGFLWDKLTGEIAAFQRLKNDCFEAQKRLMEAENKLEQALSGKMPSGKMIQDIKQAITSFKEELRSRFRDLEKRIESFKTELPNLISPCLGQERSEALIQEIDQKVAEQFNHFESDRTTVANLFSERGDKETGQLESRPMSIFVWARNPDIDLYQGNYSPCCICIDSAHMGAESTIADYNTDLGIQIVNIWDEAKNEPVTAAWCWLGQNEKGEKALVIDNIESNTLYSSNFPEQLSNELFEYIKEYTRKIGVNKVVLGKANNDLPISSELAKLSEDGNQYEKIGGSNRSDGYFLEAEAKSVKLVWQVEEKKVVEKKTKETPKVEFKNLKVESISDKNLAKILQAERKIYAGTGLISGQTMVEDMKRGNGFEYSVAMRGMRPGKKQAEIVAYIVAVEDETDEGDKSIYMEDIAVLPEAQRQGIGWEAMKEFVAKLKAKATKDGQPILLDMHLRETSQTFMANHHADLESLGVKLIEEALVPDYYDEGEDSLYRVYQIKAD